MVKTIKYGYYPGCSLESTAKEYNLSIAAAAKLLDVELVELDDWNCCGATAYFSVDDTLAAAVSGLARNVRPPLPWRPSKLRLLVETLYWPGES